MLLPMLMATRCPLASLRYVLDMEAGCSDREFVNGVRDKGRNRERLADFAQMPQALTAELTEAHVAALRLYTTAAFASINKPLRDSGLGNP